MSYEEWRQTFHAKRTFTLDAFGLKDDHTRRSIFEANIEKIKAQNTLYAKGESGFKFGVNQFSDLTTEEFVENVLGKLPEKPEMPEATKIEGVSAASSIDWRQRGAVTPVKNQGQCGSCWSFSTTGAVEGAVAVATGKLVSLSEKQIVDCTSSYGEHGCGGGWATTAMKYIIDNGGIDSESDYPYQARQSSCNRSKQARHVAGIKGYKVVQRDSVSQLKAALNLTPVSVTVDASGFQHYNGGVLDHNCGTRLNHAVLAVGYTDGSNSRFPNTWIVKNSWGTWWGVSGYVYISQSTRYSSHGLCGILMQNQYATGGWTNGGHPVVSPTLPPSKPGPNPSCKDDNANCPYWAQRGECRNNPGYMLAHCKKSCNNCSACQDNNARCQEWAQRGECRNNPGYMLQQCKKSCNICSTPTVQAPSSMPNVGSHAYQNPFTTSCSMESTVITTGKNNAGSICAPACEAPDDDKILQCVKAPAGVNAEAKCMFQTSAGKFCALSCNPSEKDTCGNGMTCELSTDTVYPFHTPQYVCLFHQQFKHVYQLQERLNKASNSQ